MAVVAAVVPGATAYAAAGEELPTAPLSESQKALEQAQESGQRVEVTGQRTARTTVFANPDGYTFTLEESSTPVRAPAADGGWQAPDPTLVKRADGTVGPKGAAVQMAFSGGGDTGPLARIEDQGRSLALDWPGKLPAPRLDGPSAVYPEVLKDVDLQVTATSESFKYVLVVKTPEAAASDELEKLTFDLDIENLTVREGAAGNLAAVDGNGTTVFKAPPARMWDSAGQDSDTQPQWVTVQAADTPGGAQEGQPSDPAESAPSGSGLEPGQGDTVARIDVEVTKDALSVIPDAEMLTSTEPSAFPVFIDPPVTWGASERTLLRSDGYESYGWGNGDDGMGKGAGKCGSWSGYYCGPGYVQKLYFEFSPEKLAGKKILDATFRVTEPWAFQCDPRWVDLVRTNNISSSTTWSSRPKELDWMGDRWVSAGRGSLCDPDSPDAPIEFNDNPEESNENLTPTVQSFAAGKFSRLTLEIRAHDESDASAWKRFKNDAVLAVDFVGLPEKPDPVGFQPPQAGITPDCEPNEDMAAVTSDPTPSFRATPHTKPGGGEDAQLKVYFDVDVKNADNTWSDVTPPAGGSLNPSPVGDNQPVSLEWSNLAEGKLYRFHAWTWSYYGNGSHLSSKESDGFCFFKIDKTAPKAPKVTIETPYTQCTTNACAPGGAPGEKVDFTFEPVAGDTISLYMYRLSTDETWSTKEGSTVSVEVTPPRAGFYSLYVIPQDDVGIGRRGERTVIDFMVDDGGVRVGEWHFNDEGEGDTAVDSATKEDNADNAALAGGAKRDDHGRLGLITHDDEDVPLSAPVTDQALTLNGTTSYAATSGQVLETRASYTISTWARLTEAPTHNSTVLSQDGTHRSPFYLGYEHSAGRWALRAVNKDAPVTDTWSYAKVDSVDAPTIGAWTLLTGVYDSEMKEIRLYVNGRLQGAKPYTTAWAATGPLQIGRTQWSDTYSDYFKGNVDEPTIWQRALQPEEIADLAQPMNSPNRAAVELVANWSADHGSGTTIPDGAASGYGKSLTLTGGASLDGRAIVLDGVDDAATASGPMVDDTGSFTVTTLAALDPEKLATKPVGYTGQVLGQRTADGSAWGIWYKQTAVEYVTNWDTGLDEAVPVGAWYFGRLNTNGTFSAVASAAGPVEDGAVRLTGVFNASEGTISLYLSSVRTGDPQTFTAKIGSGDFALGKGSSDGTWAHYLPARVSEARLWAGAMASYEQLEETVRD
ncbi:LamG domain protein jellyroll fold domain protein [Streptomyces sp. KPB2]|uniref:LamG domain-containing protein n=1 Tax=Streptomyces sp. KPB2 TaxID=2305221 RepID=UPI000F70E381|nr:LamG domain-containing protein [Streptomyces sp. KPB2]AZM77875.1 LamG domain protein jellyroll fold domain protein [Streptomyces sp. KPB2]